MKTFNEWLEGKNLEEGWWPFGKKEEPSEPEVQEERPKPSRTTEIPWYEDPKNKLKGDPGSFTECPHCGRAPASYYGIEGGIGECYKCKRKYWLDKDQQRSAKRMIAWDKARTRGSSSYDFEGELYHTDPKGAARAAERAKNAIRGDLSNI
jgi:hypothetical protein